jgi:hypothetical protein
MLLEISIWYIVVRFSYYNLIIGKGMILIGKIIKKNSSKKQSFNE